MKFCRANGLIGVKPKKTREEVKGKVEFQDKLLFSEKLRSLSREVLANIIELIWNECPNAVEDIDKERVQIKVDSLSYNVFQKANQIASAFSEESGLKRSRKD